MKIGQMQRHSLLQKQISRHLPAQLLQSPEYGNALANFLDVISSTYGAFDSDRLLLERSMELSSQELLVTNREMRAQNAELQAIYKITLDVQKNDATPSVHSRIAQEVARVTGFPIVCLKLLDRPTQTYTIAALTGFAVERGRELRAVRIPAGELAVLEGGDVYANNDFAADGPPHGFLAALGAGTLISVPMKVGGLVLGRLTVAHPDAGQGSPRISNWLQSVAGQLASELERRNLNDLSEHQKASMVAASKMSELGKMAGGVAHEINTPLNAILLCAEGLEREAEGLGLGKIAKKATDIVATVKRIATIVKGLRTFSRDGSRDPFNPADISQIVRGTVALCGERFKHNEIDLRIDITPGLSIHCRETQISQLILNLLNNAYDAVLSLPERWIAIQAIEHGKNIEIWVTDSGHGLPAEAHDKLGVPFFTTKPIGAGTGLGLSISLGIARDHGGGISVDRHCANTRFVVTLPKEHGSTVELKSAA
jgi:C4-dicarboxylate-specific signal transduction histidine kinase